jgi:hypothetical protein
LATKLLFFIPSFISKETHVASRAKTIGSTDPAQPGTALEERERILQSTREQEIRNRAYEIYLQRGAQPGYEVEDWLQAERELTT